jgi:hypothetical protein
VTKPQGAGAICGGLVVIAMMQFCYVDLNGSPNINSRNKKLIMSFCFWVGRIQVVLFPTNGHGGFGRDLRYRRPADGSGTDHQ